MQKAILFIGLFGLICFTPSLYSQSSFTLDHFDEINVTGNVEVILAAGNTEEATLETENIPEHEVTIKVNKDILKIKVVEGVFYKNEKITVNLTYKTLQAIRGNAGAQIRNISVLDSDQLLVRSGSGSKITLRVELNDLNAGATEGGILSIEGETVSQKISASTGGRFEGFDLESRDAYVKVNTGGIAEVFATDLIEAVANTGGSITYKGDPESTSFKSILSGEVKKL